MQRIYIFKRFERFWHWAQALLIIFMLVSGFEIHGTYHLFGFHDAVAFHTVAAWSLITLWVFAIFWHFTTGEWKQYIPTMEKVDAVIKYYLTGIFTDAPHPFRVTQLKKHNPLQRMAYLQVKVMINPLIWITGMLLLFYADWQAWGIGALQLGTVAVLHTIGAFLMLIFLVVHIYFATTGHTPMAHIKAMITGWDEVEDEHAATRKA
jgi:thiosulfate reductase cytochrome b subunit